MKALLPVIAALLTVSARAEALPKVFEGLLEAGVAVKGRIGMVVPPKEIDKYIAKVEAAARKDSAWFREYSAKSKPGVPLPYDERLGVTKEEYAEYLGLWAKREFKPGEEVMVMLRPGVGGLWSLASTGGASALSTLRYEAAKDVFRSPNGELKRIADIKADPASILGEWSGSEWRFEEETSLGRTKENFAIGRMAGDRFGLIVYRVQELSSEGRPLLDRSLVIRFPLGAGAKAPATKPVPKAAAESGKR